MITIEQAAQLLALIQGHDHRTVGEVDIVVWCDALGDLETVECVEAVRAHYRDTDAWIMPAHVRQRVRAARAAAVDRAHNEQLRRDIDAAQGIDRETARAAYLRTVDAFANATGRPAPAGWDAFDDCGWCGAHRGQPCTTADRPRSTPHPSRQTGPDTHDRRAS